MLASSGRGGWGEVAILGDGVVATTSPRVATGETLQGEPSPFEGPVATNGLQGVLRTGGCETARRRGEGRDAALVEAYQKEHRPGDKAFDQFTIHSAQLGGWPRILEDFVREIYK